MNRALGAATAGVLLLSPLALSACRAPGQVTQTATQQRDKVGAMAQVGDITVRAVELVSPRAAATRRATIAELTLAIVNSGQETDTLVGVDGEGFGDVEIRTAATSGTTTTGTGGSGQLTRSRSPPTPPCSSRQRRLDHPHRLDELPHRRAVPRADPLVRERRVARVTVPVTVANPEDEQERRRGLRLPPGGGAPERAPRTRPRAGVRRGVGRGSGSE